MKTEVVLDREMSDLIKFIVSGERSPEFKEDWPGPRPVGEPSPPYKGTTKFGSKRRTKTEGPITTIEGIEEVLRSGKNRPPGEVRNGYIINPESPSSFMDTVLEYDPRSANPNSWVRNEGDVVTVVGFYDSKTRALVFSGRPRFVDIHAEIFMSLANEEAFGASSKYSANARTVLEDRSTRFRFGMNIKTGKVSSVVFGVDYAGGGKSVDRAYDNIYRTMGVLERWGLPKNTEVIIYDPDLEKIETTLGEAAALREDWPGPRPVGEPSPPYRGGDYHKKLKKMSGYVRSSEDLHHSVLVNVKDIDELGDADNEGRFFGMGGFTPVIYDLNSKTLSFGISNNAQHRHMAATLFSDPDERISFMDGSVRFYTAWKYDSKDRLVPKYLEFDIGYAGVVKSSSASGRVEAINNIYKAMDGLSYIGVDKTTPVKIVVDRGEDIDTTLEEMLSESWPGPRPVGEPSPPYRKSGDLKASVQPGEFQQVPESQLMWQFGHTRTPYVQAAPGSVVQGKLVGPDDPDVPETVYHVTTNIGAVKKSGKLSVAAGMSAGGLGGGSESQPGVSLTTSYEDAKLIQREMRRITGSVRSSASMRKVLGKWAREDEKLAGLEKGFLQGSVDAAMEHYNFHWSLYPEKHSDSSWVKSLRFDAGRTYRNSRETRGGQPNILVFSHDKAKFSRIRSNQIKIIKIPKSSVFASGGAVLVNTQPGDFLHEVRVYGDVPVGRVRVTEIAEAHLDWKERAQQLTGHQRNIFKRYMWGPGEVRELEKTFVQMREVAYSDELNRLLALVGCGRTRAVLTNGRIRGNMADMSREDAFSVARTYNYELVGAILKIAEDHAGNPTREQYALGLQNWENRRGVFKGDQLSEWIVNQTSALAAKEFFDRNDQYVPGMKTARLLGPNPAAEPICQGWLNRGEVPLDEALDNPPPYHLNCPHVWAYRIRNVVEQGTCPKLWRGE